MDFTFYHNAAPNGAKDKFTKVQEHNYWKQKVLQHRRCDIMVKQNTPTKSKLLRSDIISIMNNNIEACIKPNHRSYITNQQSPIFFLMM